MYYILYRCIRIDIIKYALYIGKIHAPDTVLYVHAERSNF